MRMAKRFLYNISADGAGLRSCFRCFRTGSVEHRINSFVAYGTFAPMIKHCGYPFAAACMTEFLAIFKSFRARLPTIFTAVIIYCLCRTACLAFEILRCCLLPCKAMLAYRCRTRTFACRFGTNARRRKKYSYHNKYSYHMNNFLHFSALLVTDFLKRFCSEKVYGN